MLRFAWPFDLSQEMCAREYETQPTIAHPEDARANSLATQG